MKLMQFLRLSSNMISSFDDKINFPYELLLTDRQVANLRKAFANNLSTDIKLIKMEDFLVDFLVH